LFCKCVQASLVIIVVISLSFISIDIIIIIIIIIIWAWRGILLYWMGRNGTGLDWAVHTGRRTGNATQQT